MEKNKSHQFSCSLVQARFLRGLSRGCSTLARFMHLPFQEAFVLGLLGGCGIYKDKLFVWLKQAELEIGSEAHIGGHRQILWGNLGLLTKPLTNQVSHSFSFFFYSFNLLYPQIIYLSWAQFINLYYFNTKININLKPQIKS